MAIYSIGSAAPQVAISAWVADSAEIIGRVELGENVSIWFGTIIRGDQQEPIRIGQGSNIQDCCVLHSDPGAPLTVGSHVTVGHRAVLHGCTVGDGSLIGIGAVIMNGARIGKRCLVGAGAVVTEGKVFADESLIVGTPAIAKRPLTVEQLRDMERGAQFYIENSRRFSATMVKLR